MVTLKTFLPDTRTVDTLTRLHCPVTVSLPANSKGGATELIVLANRDACVSLSFDYHDIVFKFELFALVASPCSASSLSNQKTIAHIDRWDVVKCLFRFEWERPALPGEVPNHYEQIVQRRGERDQIPQNASAIGVSMVGIAFWNIAQDKPVAAIMSNDDDPVALRLHSNFDEIEVAIAGSEKVSIQDLDRWLIELEQWQARLA